MGQVLKFLDWTTWVDAVTIGGKIRRDSQKDLNLETIKQVK
jgi:hypothetical protein